MKRFRLHWITKKSDFIFAFLLLPDATYFSSPIFLPHRPARHPGLFFDTNCLCTPTCPACLPPHQSCTITPSLRCLWGNGVCLWLILGQMTQIIFRFACLRTTPTIHFSLLLVSWGGDKNWQIYQIPSIAITVSVKYVINLYCLVKSYQILK